MSHPSNQGDRVPYIPSPRDFGLTTEQRRSLIDKQVIELRRLFLEHPTAKEAVIGMLEHARKINEGKDGVIFRLDVETLSPEQRQTLLAMDLPVDDPQAIKTLKINQPGKLLREFDVQKQAHTVLNPQNHEMRPIARVPKPTLVGEIELPQNIRDALRHYKAPETEAAEIMMMDYIQAPDLATLLYQEAYVRILSNIPTNEIRHLQIADMADVVEPRVDMRIPGRKGSTEGERLYEERKIENENLTKLLTWLSSNGFMLHRSVLEQLDQAVQSLHEAGIYHRDLHLRNVIVTGNANALEPGVETPNVFIIDFGKSTTGDTVMKEDPYQEGDARYIEDETIIRQLEPFTKTARDRHQELTQEDLRTILNEALRSRDPKKEAQRIETLSRIRTQLNTPEGTDKMLNWLFSNYGNTNIQSLHQMIDYLVVLIDEGSLSPEQTGLFLSMKTSEKIGKGGKAKRVMSLPFINILNRFVASYVKKK